MSKGIERDVARSGAVGKSIRLHLIATLFAAGSELRHMFTAGKVGIIDVLLLFTRLRQDDLVTTHRDAPAIRYPPAHGPAQRIIDTLHDTIHRIHCTADRPFCECTRAQAA